MRVALTIALSLFSWVAAASSAVAALDAAGSSLMCCSRNLAVTAFRGEGRHKFLHGLCTAHVEQLKRGEPGAVIEGSVVDSAGCVLNTLMIVDPPAPDGVLYGLGPASRAEEQYAFFDKYVFPLDPINVQDMSARYSEGVLELVGPRAAAVLADVLNAATEALPAPGRCCALGDDGSVLVLTGVGWDDSTSRSGDDLN